MVRQDDAGNFTDLHESDLETLTYQIWQVSYETSPPVQFLANLKRQVAVRQAELITAGASSQELDDAKELVRLLDDFQETFRKANIKPTQRDVDKLNAIYNRIQEFLR